MKIRIIMRQPSEDGDIATHEYSAEVNVRDWDDAYNQGREFGRLIDGLGMGFNTEQDEIIGSA